YELAQMSNSLEAIQNRMGQAGYAFSEINVQPIPNAETHTVDFVLTVQPGRKIYVNEINITGNNKTRDEVIRRELRQMESAPYDSAKLQRS
ncbi:POTRA domain-containing protein, partial [Neisseria sp. P0014.S004]|uniref:POTRA domain-containing protein n=1 Tax=Neisseria sp. P0014.S004 TaxID=3436750 RepID=UPI003F8203FC